MEAVDSWNESQGHPSQPHTPCVPREEKSWGLKATQQQEARERTAQQRPAGESLSPITTVTVQCPEDSPYIDEEHINRSDSEHFLNKRAMRIPS